MHGMAIHDHVAVFTKQKKMQQHIHDPHMELRLTAEIGHL